MNSDVNKNSGTFNFKFLNNKYLQDPPKCTTESV